MKWRVEAAINTVSDNEKKLIEMNREAKSLNDSGDRAAYRRVHYKMDGLKKLNIIINTFIQEEINLL